MNNGLKVFSRISLILILQLFINLFFGGPLCKLLGNW